MHVCVVGAGGGRARRGVERRGMGLACVTEVGCGRAQSQAAGNAHQLHHSRITCIPATTLVGFLDAGGMESEKLV